MLIRRIVALTAFVVLPVAALTAADRTDSGPIAWKKITVDKVFRSEGAAVADVNRDGKLDILVGDFWYEAPDWKLHPIRRTNEYPKSKRATGYYGDGLAGYSECMCCWADDVNGDGWPDQIVIGFPGKPAYWYENPKGQPGPWKEHVIWHSACNETPTYVDLFGTGKRALVMGWQPLSKLVSDPNTKLDKRRFDPETTANQGQMAWFAPGKDPTQLWVMHPISEPSAPGHEIPGTQRFSHGLGVGDVNGDGRQDVICAGGWWEQPADGMKATGPWKFHPAQLGEACADMHTYDMDGDGKADIISSSAHKFGIWCFQQRAGSGGSPTFLKQDLFPKLVSETHALHCVDMDGDGLKDLVTGKRFWSHGRSEPGAEGPAMLYWFKARKSSDGTTTFTPYLIDNDSGIGTQFTVIDMNGDGRPDIVTSSKKGTYIHLQASGPK
jgi:hypothetical protein